MVRTFKTSVGNRSRFFYLTTLGLARFLKETVPQVEPPAEVYCKMTHGLQKVLWESLERKCKQRDVGTRSSMVVSSGFGIYKLVDSKKGISQKDTYAPDSAKANMVEHAGSSSRSNSKGKGKDKKKNDKKGKGKSDILILKLAGFGWWVDMEATVMCVLIRVCFTLLERLTWTERCIWANSALMISKGVDGSCYFEDDITRERARVV
ncbi:hypothetical protein Tco_1018847 [Tanacetum coccineum]|uniref:Uncharacterized protein n=1 Tax=Tanacetum coccineum TaxID=301880 RepID=A0ABQ5FVH5_9ASTR